MKHILGYDIGGTKVAVSLGDEEGRILASTRLPSGATRAYRDVFPEMVDAGKQVIEEAGFSIGDVDACGVCAPGPLDVPNGRMLKSPNMQWDDVPIRDDLADVFGKNVHFDNDANGGGLAEYYFGAGRGAENLVYLTMSTGIGGGVINHGQLLQGGGGNAGELGHVILDVNGPRCGCGMNGCFEAFCGGRAVQERLQRMMRSEPCQALLDIPEVAGKIENLDYITLRKGVEAKIPEALEIWDEICLRIAQGIGIQIMTFDPDVVVLGTLAMYSGDLLLDPVRHYVPRFAWKKMLDHCQIKVTALGKSIGELAGISVGLYGLRHVGRT